ncbi:MAG TPA: penicillin-binding transpeptidase domain-containing protein [Candidatus Acidoferrales bacterium]|nr:penicillin-binding transpeptidase domain-containing protein [Candidatus Acidoferrales bacterium]
MDLRRTRLRLLIVASLAAVWMVAAAGRLAYLQLFCYSDYLARALRQQRHIVQISPKRAPIYDRNLLPLAMSIEVDSCFAVPSEIADPELAARLLAGALGVARSSIEEKLASSTPFVWLERKLPPEKARRVAALNLKGVYFQKESQRFYPKRDLAAHVLGYVDIDEKGLAGIEYELNDQIRTKPGHVLMLGDARHRLLESRENTHDTSASVVLTIDEKIQYIAEKELANAIADTHAIAGTILIQDPANGELLAVANWPRFNPNAAKDTPPEKMMDRAIAALYEPGSTFKIITLAAALEEAITRPDEVVDCQNGAIYIAGHRIRDHKPFGLLTVSQVMTESSDVGAIKIALRLGAPKFYEYIRAFGFGTPTGVDLPGESKGILRRVENWTPVSVGSISMGQEVGVTPIQLITAVSAIANGGLVYRPHVVKELRRDGQAVPPMGTPNTAQPRRAISEKTAATLRGMLEGVVLHGTGVLARLDGWTAAGKTGSAQKIDPATGRYSATQLIASFSGFAPLNNPAVTILVSLDSPVGLHEGGQVAAPVFKRVAEQVLSYLDVPRDVPVRQRLLAVSRRTISHSDLPDITDFSPAESPVEAEVSAEPIGRPARAERAEPQTVALAQGEGILVPELKGETVREVTEKCMRLQLSPVLIGTGVAVEQSPEHGKWLRPGGRVTVRFAAAVKRNTSGGED